MTQICREREQNVQKFKKAREGVQNFCFCSLNIQNLRRCRSRRLVDLKLPNKKIGRPLKTREAGYTYLCGSRRIQLSWRYEHTIPLGEHEYNVLECAEQRGMTPACCGHGYR